MRTDIVTDPAVIAKLPNAGSLSVRWQWFWFRNVWDRIFGGYPKFRFRSIFYLRYRVANAERISIGPLCITRPMPWLLGPAKTLHPEAFH